jgi:hypothetical protein
MISEVIDHKNTTHLLPSCYCLPETCEFVGHRKQRGECLSSARGTAC